jgi:dienelactone hydrolase
MRPIEIILLTLLTIRMGRSLGRRPGISQFQWLSGLAGLSLLVHLTIEGQRWQLYPAYGLIVWLLISDRLRGRRVPHRRAAGWWTLIPVLLLLGLSWLPPMLMPVPSIPNPTGPFDVGTRQLHLVDLGRSDPYAPDPSAPRELMVQVWYPAAAESDGIRAPWMDSIHLIGPAISEWIGMPAFFINHVQYAETQALLGGEPLASERPFPVLHFSHGYGGLRAQNTFQMLELASHGYVVVATEHTYAAAVTVFSDGRTATLNLDTLPRDITDQQEYEIQSNSLLAQWSQDIGFVLDHFARLTATGSNDPLAGLLNMAQIGILGHSTGGGAAVEFCSEDPRCQAGLAMDPWLVPVAGTHIQAGPSAPFIFMFSESWSGDRNNELFSALFDGMPGSAAYIRIDGTAHYDFSDLPALTPLAATLGLKGPIPGPEIQRIIGQLSLAFFDARLIPDREDRLVDVAEAFQAVKLLDYRP